MVKTSLEEIELFHNQCTIHQMRDLSMWDFRLLLKCMDAFSLEHADWIESEDEEFTFDRLYCRIREAYTFLYMRNSFDEFQRGREIQRQQEEERKKNMEEEARKDEERRLNHPIFGETWRKAEGKELSEESEV